MVNGDQTALVPIISSNFWALNCNRDRRCNGHRFGGKALRRAVEAGILQRIAAVEVLILHLPNTRLQPNAAIRVQTVGRKVTFKKGNAKQKNISSCKKPMNPENLV